ncbi:MAG: hypothetical protein F4169_22755, partial [Gammaproteobacteria bacterium]|nr:hypothetical protein [Gammaproteobacteria bacterium]
MIFSGWDTPLALLQMEVVQREYEGHRVPQDLKERITALDVERDAMNFEGANTLYGALDELPKDPEFPYVQPNDLEGIRRERPAGPRQVGTVADADLLDRFHAAWTGRAAGCALGKPVEGMGIRGQRGMGGRQAIRTYLENRRQWPLES